MSPTKLVFSLHDLHHDQESQYAHGWYQAVLSDGVQEATIKASSLLSQPLLGLLWAVRSLLLGASDSKCSWWKGSWYEAPEEHRWLFSRKNEHIQIHIVCFSGSPSGRSDEQGRTVLRLESDLLRFAKRLSQQLSQLLYQAGTEGGSPAVPLQDYQHLREAIVAFEQTRRGNQGEHEDLEAVSGERTTDPQERAHR
jgi:hypothetical protein